MARKDFWLVSGIILLVCSSVGFAVDPDARAGADDLFFLSAHWQSPVGDTNRVWELDPDGWINEKDLLLRIQGREGSNPEEIVIGLPGVAAGAKPLTLVRIPAGSFQMGSPDTERGRYSNESPVHTVSIGYDFYMGKWEVTQAQWQALMGTNPGIGYGVGDDYPVYLVSWDDIRGEDQFIEKLNALGQGTFRLPSEAEWEYACRAGTSTRFYFGDSLGCSDESQDCAAGTLPGNRSDYVWYWYNYDNPTYGCKPVGTKLPNQFGLFDMSGNVREWCEDDWRDHYSDAPVDGSARVYSPRDYYRLYRGGAWGKYFYESRSASRDYAYPDTKYYTLGFRVAWTP